MARLARQPGGMGMGPGGTCYCPSCDYHTTHTLGMPCTSITCPNCGTRLLRK